MSRPEDMTNEELRVAVAEAYGFSPVLRGVSRDLNIWKHPKTGHPFVFGQLPNCPEDLNACADFERSLNSVEYMEYRYQLRKLAQEKHETVVDVERAVISAPGPNRCVAFIKTMTK